MSRVFNNPFVWMVVLVLFLAFFYYDRDFTEVRSQYVKKRMQMFGVHFSELDGPFEAIRLFATVVDMDDNQSNMLASDVKAIFYDREIATRATLLVANNATKNPFESRFWGKVRMRSTDREKLDCEELRYFFSRKEIFTQDAVRMVRGSAVITGTELRMNTETKVGYLDRHVRIEVFSASDTVQEPLALPAELTPMVLVGSGTDRRLRPGGPGTPVATAAAGPGGVPAGASGSVIADVVGSRVAPAAAGLASGWGSGAALAAVASASRVASGVVVAPASAGSTAVAALPLALGIGPGGMDGVGSVAAAIDVRGNDPGSEPSVGVRTGHASGTVLAGFYPPLEPGRVASTPARRSAGSASMTAAGPAPILASATAPGLVPVASSAARSPALPGSRPAGGASTPVAAGFAPGPALTGGRPASGTAGWDGGGADPLAVVGMPVSASGAALAVASAALASAAGDGPGAGAGEPLAIGVASAVAAVASDAAAVFRTLNPRIDQNRRPGPPVRRQGGRHGR